MVEDHYRSGAALITSQLPMGRWHDLTADPTIADVFPAGGVACRL